MATGISRIATGTHPVTAMPPTAPATTVTRLTVTTTATAATTPGIRRDITDTVSAALSAVWRDAPTTVADGQNARGIFFSRREDRVSNSCDWSVRARLPMCSLHACAPLDPLDAYTSEESRTLPDARRHSRPTPLGHAWGVRLEFLRFDFFDKTRPFNAERLCDDSVIIQITTRATRTSIQLGI